MANDSTRSLRGWAYATGIASLIGGAVFYAPEAQKWLQKHQGYSPRTTKHITSPRVLRNFATEEASWAFEESLQLDESRHWTDVRRQPALAIAPFVEPSQRIVLSAPVPAPSQLASDPLDTTPTSQATNLRLTSVSKPVDQPPRYVTTPLGLSALSTNAWPAPSSLLQELSELEESATSQEELHVANWSQQMRAILDQLTVLQSMKDPGCTAIFQQIRDASTDVLKNPERFKVLDYQLSRQQYRAAHAMLRRVSVWESVWNCMNQWEQQAVNPARLTIDFQALIQDINQTRRFLAKTNDVQGWSRFLMLQELDDLARLEELDAEKASEIARTYLARVHGRLSSAQSELVSQSTIQQLTDRVLPLAWNPVDYRQMMVSLETIESDSAHRCRSQLATSIQSLRYMAQPVPTELADTINTFYRNANLRIAVSKDLLERGLPKPQVAERPVRQRILGADTRGASQVETQLGIELVPDRHAWNLVLRLNGDVQAKTHSSRGPATFYNDSIAKVDTARRIRVDVNGMQVAGEQAKVDSNDQLRGFDTDLDSLPIIGDMFRFVVRQQFDSQRGIAQRITRRNIAEQTDKEFDRQLATQMRSAENGFQSWVLKPLDRLELNPMVIDLETTENRLIARYRMAGDDQLAAHTPRPLAPADAYASVQIHESAINNAIENFGLSGRDWTLPELGQQLAYILNQTDWTFPAETPTDVTVRFDDARPITVEFQEGVMKLALRIQELRQGNQPSLNDFIIRTHYSPTANGLLAEFTHTGVISVDGKKLSMRERLPLRAIFAKVFAGRSTIPIIAPNLSKDPRAEGLAVSQQEIQDGWLAFAVSPISSPHVAALQGPQPSQTQQR